MISCAAVALAALGFGSQGADAQSIVIGSGGPGYVTNYSYGGFVPSYGYGRSYYTPGSRFGGDPYHYYTGPRNYHIGPHSGLHIGSYRGPFGVPSYGVHFGPHYGGHRSAGHGFRRLFGRRW